MSSQLLAIAIALELSPLVMIPILIELFGQVVGPRRQQYLVPVLAGTRHAILCMRNWAQRVGSRWGLACGLGPVCRIPLGTSLCVGPSVQDPAGD